MFYTLGPVPYDEACAQVGQPDYRERALEECRRYKAQLERLFPEARFEIKGFPHDFGTYYEVVVYGDQNAYIEDEAPANWDDEPTATIPQP